MGLEGYVGRVREVLEEAGVDVGDEVEVRSGGKIYRGILMARYELAEPGYIVIKLPNGYNIGVKVEEDVAVRKLATAKKPRFVPPPRPPIPPKSSEGNGREYWWNDCE